jgi:serine/threonine-protein kinase HipA
MLDAKLIQKIKILKNNIYVGDLVRSVEGCEIHFADSGAKNKKLTLNISSKEKMKKFAGVGLPPYFAGLLPEGLRLKAIVKKIKTSEDDLFSLLVASGNDPVGDIHFENSDSENIYEDVPEDFEDIRKKLNSGSVFDSKYLAGVQSKVSVDRVSLPISIKKKKKSYILKLSSDEFPDIVQNEIACLQIAKLCGLDVNRAVVVQDVNKSEALLVERFDRSWNSENKNLNRLWQEDACQFLNRYPSDKYLLSIQDIADGIVLYCASSEIEILNLLQQVAFSYLIGNGDLHAKNISLLEPTAESGFVMSPCYDIVCTALYGDQKMALMMDGKNQNLKRKNFIDFGQRYNLPEAAIGSMLNRLVTQFDKNYSILFSVPLAHKKEKFLNQLFKERIQHLGSN